MRGLSKLAVSFAAVALLAAPALAQGQRGGFGMGGGAMLLSNKSVQDELKLTDEQREKATAAVTAVREKHREDFAALRELPREEIGAKMRELNTTISEELKKELAGVLKPDQEKRFGQIQLQVQGYQAFANPDIQAKLKLTDDQKEKIKGIGEDVNAQMREAREAAGGDFQALGQKMTELRKASMEKAAATLTDEQTATWKEMVGAPFEIKFEQPRRPGIN